MKKRNILILMLLFFLNYLNFSIYLSSEDPENQEVDIKKRKKVLIKDTEEIKTKNEKGKRYYLVVIEPEETRAISIWLK